MDTIGGIDEWFSTPFSENNHIWPFRNYICFEGCYIVGEDVDSNFG